MILQSKPFLFISDVLVESCSFSLANLQIIIIIIIIIINFYCTIINVKFSIAYDNDKKLRSELHLICFA